jgi:Na+/H+-translocating membrane pyrophosphatase
MSAKGLEGAKPMSALNRGYAWASGVSIAGLALAVYFLPGGGTWLFMAGFMGIASGGLLFFTSYYYSAPKYRPSRLIAEFSGAGPAPAALGGVSAALESAAAQMVIVAAALLGSYYCGIRGLEAYMALGLASPMGCGFYGVAAAASGFMMAEAYMGAAGSLFPIAAAAEALAGLTRQSGETRANARALRELGETLRPLAGGYTLGAAALAFILLFAAWMDSVKVLSGLTFESVNIARVEILIGGLMGAALVCVFGALVARALLSASAGAGVKPTASALSARSLRYAALPGLLGAAAPAAAGIAFGRLGPGAAAPAAFLTVCAVCGMLGGAVIDGCAWAWDGAGKSMRLGGPGGDKEARNAVPACAAAGDTLRKASFAPALYALIKLAAASALVLAPLF